MSKLKAKTLILCWRSLMAGESLAAAGTLVPNGANRGWELGTLFIDPGGPGLGTM